MAEEKVRLNDPVLYAVQCFEDAGYTFGDIIPREWFLKRFGIVEPQSIAEADENKMIYAKYLGAFRAKVLNRHKMALRTKEGLGQEIVMPGDQTEWALQEAKGQISKELEKAKDRLSNIKYSELSDQEIRENTDAIAHLGFFKRKAMKKLGW
jgi:ABC-type sugar transport system ATPase subunit